MDMAACYQIVVNGVKQKEPDNWVGPLTSIPSVK